MARIHRVNIGRSVFSLMGVICIIAAVVLIAIFMLRGETTSIDSGSIETAQSLACKGDNLIYPYSEGIDAEKRSLKINVILNNDELSSVSLIYKIYPKDASAIQQNTTNLHIAVNKSFGESGLGTDALGATYSSLADSVQMTFYAEARSINGVTAKYFLLENTSGNYVKDAIMQAYSNKGLSCILEE